MGDYISREEMIEQTKARIVLGAPKFNTGIKAAIEVATSIPAADVVAVRHGMWLSTPTGWVYCSVCGEEPPQETNARTKYCPSCGAVMDGGLDDG